MAAPAGQRKGPGLPAAESDHRRTIPPCSQPGPAQPRAGPAPGRAASYHRPASPPGSTSGPSSQAARGSGAPILRGPARHPDRRCTGDQRTRCDMPHRMRPVFPPGWPARNRSTRSPFVGGTLVAAGKDVREEHGQEARPVVGRGQAVDRECAARARTRYRPRPAAGPAAWRSARGPAKETRKMGRRRGDQPARHPDPHGRHGRRETASPCACHVPATPAIRSSAAPDHAGWSCP